MPGSEGRLQGWAREVDMLGLEGGGSTNETAVCSDFREVDPEGNWVTNPQSKNLGMPNPLRLC